MTMKLRYFSDLHLEFVKPVHIQKFLDKIHPGADDEVCVLAGDIGSPHEPNYRVFINFISSNFRKSFVIAGNHEYYSMVHSIDDTNQVLEKIFQDYENITYLHNSFEYYRGYCFIGTTLWTRITNSMYFINDTVSIPNFDQVKYNELHSICKSFLEQTVEKHDNCIVITHHIPSEALIDKKYKCPSSSPYNQWFYVNMEDFMKRQSNIKCWIYGHTHTPSSTTLYNIPLVCNPIGYPGENRQVDLIKSILV